MKTLRRRSPRSRKSKTVITNENVAEVYKTILDNCRNKVGEIVEGMDVF